MSPFDNQNPTLISYSKLPQCSFVYSIGLRPLLQITTRPRGARGADHCRQVNGRVVFRLITQTPGQTPGSQTLRPPRM